MDFIVYTRAHIEKYLLQCKNRKELNIPIFVRSKKKSTSMGILIPVFRYFNEREKYFKSLDEKSKTVNWESKINEYFWRGRPSGANYKNGSNLRLRLVKKSLSNQNVLDAAFIEIRHLMKNLLAANLKNLKLSKIIDKDEQIIYKYLIAIEGDSYPSSLHWQLYSNSLTIFVDTPYIEWYYAGIKPYVHYIPLKSDCSDLEDKMIWLQENDSTAEEIAKNATEFYRSQVSNERTIHYVYRLLCRYKEKFKELVEPESNHLNFGAGF